jgi:hypothetical protein
MSKDLSKKNVDRLIETGLIIADEEPRGAAIGYMHAVLSQVGLPRSKTEERRFERVSGGAHLLVQAGELWNGRQFVEQPIPYGPKPRVMMADLFSYALKHKTRTITLGDSVTDYLHRLGLTSQGGKQGPLTLFRRQAQALSVCRMTLGINYGGKACTISGQPIQQFEAWMDDRGGQRTLWPASLELSAEFFESLREFAVPLDMRAVHSLSGSALALDLYTALAHRLHRLRKPLLLRWASWSEQFGQEYSDPRDFRRELRRQIKAVLTVYPAARVEQVTGGLMLYPSPPPVPKLQVIRGGA